MRCQNIDIILNVLNAVKSVRLKVMMEIQRNTTYESSELESFRKRVWI